MRLIGEPCDDRSQVPPPNWLNCLNVIRVDLLQGKNKFSFSTRNRCRDDRLVALPGAFLGASRPRAAERRQGLGASSPPALKRESPSSREADTSLVHTGNETSSFTVRIFSGRFRTGFLEIFEDLFQQSVRFVRGRVLVGGTEEFRVMGSAPRRTLFRAEK